MEEVYTTDKAITRLKEMIINEVKNDCDNDVIKDLLDNVKVLSFSNWNYVLIAECPMSASGIDVYQLKKT